MPVCCRGGERVTIKELSVDSALREELRTHASTLVAQRDTYLAAAEDADCVHVTDSARAKKYYSE